MRIVEHVALPAPGRRVLSVRDAWFSPSEVVAATDAVAAPGGVYAWMLSRVDTAAGDSTTLSWQRNPSGRAFLAEARWGGRGDGGEYRARFDYEALTAPMVSYVAGAPVQLDRRVIRVTFEARVAAAYATRWRYDLAYQASPSGPAFYLQRLTRTFASGSSEPAITYDYDLNVERFAAALGSVSQDVVKRWLSLPKARRRSCRDRGPVQLWIVDPIDIYAQVLRCEPFPDAKYHPCVAEAVAEENVEHPSYRF